MPRGKRTTLAITLTPAEYAALTTWARSVSFPARRVRRAQVILAVAAGVPITTVAARVGVSRRFVYKWARRFLGQRLAGLYDTPARLTAAQRRARGR